MNKLLISSNCIEVQCQRGDTATQELVTQFYPLHSNRIGTQFKMSIHKIPDVLRVFRGLHVDNIHQAPQPIQDYYNREMSGRQVISELLQRGAKGDPYVTPTLELMKHQQLGREIAQARDRFGFFYDTRTGKTPLSLAVIHDDLRLNPDHKWLVICPLILIENAWLEDAKTFVDTIGIVNCHAATKKKRMEALQRPGNIYVTNVESFASYKEHFEQMSFYGCIVDESSTMKSPSSAQSKALVDFSYQMKRWYLLTGTPAPNGEWEYYMQLKSIDPFCVASSYSQFKQRYFTNVSYNPQFEKLVLREDTKDELYDILKANTLYVDKEDVLDTPGRTFETVNFDLDPDVMALYAKMKNELYIALNEDKTLITAPSSAAKLNKLNQITSGFIIDTRAKKENAYNDTQDQLPEWYLLSNTRYEKLQDILDRDLVRGQQVLIWANYRREFEVLQEMFGTRCRCIYGGTTIAEKTENLRMFKAGDIQYLIANPASADKGLTLTNAHIAIYFSLGWSYELFKQSMERIYGDRRKQPKHCLYYILIANKTIDRILYEDVLQGKADASLAVLQHLKGGL